MKSKQHFATLAVIFSSSLAFSIPPVESPFAPPTPAINGQLRFRTELDQKAMLDSSTNKTLFNSQMRSRLGFTASPSDKISVKLELQDTRYMGSEPPTPATNPAGSSIGNNKGVDLLQGYATLTEGSFAVALGRQKMSLGAGRFLSTLEWSPTSRSFDGLSLNYSAERFNVTGLMHSVRDSSEKLVEDRLLLTGLYLNH